MRSYFRIRAILLEMDVYIIHRVTGKLNDCTYDEHQKMSQDLKIFIHAISTTAHSSCT